MFFFKYKCIIKDNIFRVEKQIYFLPAPFKVGDRTGFLSKKAAPHTRNRLFYPL